MSASPAPTPLSQAGNATQADLYNQVFGEGSDVSSLSDSEDERPRPRLAFPPRPPARSPSNSLPPEDKDDDDEDRDEDEVYVPGTTSNAAKIPNFKKTARQKDVDEDEDEDRATEKMKRTKKKRRVEGGHRTTVRTEDVDDEEAAPVYNENTQRRMALEERIDNVGKKPAMNRRKKKGDDDVDIVDGYHDEVCARIRDRMITAAERDKASNDAKLPATAKLAMLDEVMGVLRNTTLWQSIVDNGVLDAVRQWLEPIYPSGALPAVGIQKAIFEVLPKMDLDTQTLKECRIGPIVLFYTKTKRVTPAINRSADSLVQAWSRPIIKRPASFRNRHVETQDNMGGEVVMDDAARKEWRKRFDTKAALKDNEGRKRARPYLSKEIQYTVAPQSRLQHHSEDLQHVSRIQTDNRKFNKFARQMKAGGGRR